MVYKTAAKYGHKLAKMLAPEKVKRTTKAGLKMLPKGMQKGFVDLQKSEHVLARGAHKAWLTRQHGKDKAKRKKTTGKFSKAYHNWVLNNAAELQND